MTAVNTTMHEPADGCLALHCFWHHVDEPAAGAYIVCPECMHAYRTAGELRREYRRQYWATARNFGDPLWRRIWRVLTIRARDIHFCQHCIHDF